MTRVCAVLGTFVLVCSLATPAQAIPITEQTFIASDGVVVVTFVSNEAGYTSELFQDGSSGDGVGGIFDNPTTTAGATIDLGPVGFEDVFGGGDLDSNDLVLAFTDVSPADGGASLASVNVVDEPSSLLMFAFSLVALVFVMKRQKA